MSKNLPLFFNSQKFLIFFLLLILSITPDFARANNEEIGRYHDPREGLFERLGSRSASSLQLKEPWWHEIYPDIDKFLKKVERCSSIEDIKNLEQEFADKIGFHLTTVTSQYGALLPRTVYFTSAPLHVELLKTGLSLVKTPEDFLKLTRHHSMTGPAYQQGIDLFVHESLDFFFETNPSVDDILELGNEVSFELVLDKVRDETITFFIRLNDVEKRRYPLRIELIERGLPFVKSIEDYFRLIEWKGGLSIPERLRDAYEKVLLKSFNPFFSLHPSFANILRLDSLCHHIFKRRSSFWRRIVRPRDLSSWPEQVLARRGISFTQTVEEYLILLRKIEPPSRRAKTISESLPHFLSLNPSLSAIQSVRKDVRDAQTDVALRERGYSMAVEVRDPTGLARIHPNVLQSYDSHPKLKERSDDLIRQNLDPFFALHPSPADIASLAHNIFHSDFRLEVFQKGLGSVQTADEVVDLIVQVKRIAACEEEKQTLETFVSTHVDDIFALAPTAADVAKLRETFCHSPLGVQFSERGLALATSAHDFLLLTEGHWQTISERDRVISHSLDHFFEMKPSPTQLLQLMDWPLSPDTLRRLVEWALLEVTSADGFNNLVKKYNESPGKEKLELGFVLKTIPLFFSKVQTVEKINAYISRAQIIINNEAHEAIVERALRYIETPEEYETLHLPPEEKRSRTFLKILSNFEQTKLPYLVFQKIAVTHPKSLHEMTVFEKGKRVVLPNAVLKELHYDSLTHRIRGVMVVERSAYEVFWSMEEKTYVGLHPAIDPKTHQPIDAEKYLEGWREKRAKEEEMREAAALQPAQPKPSLAHRITDSLSRSWESLVDSVVGLFSSRETEVGEPTLRVATPPPLDPSNSLENSLSESRSLDPSCLGMTLERTTTPEAKPPAVPSVEQSLCESSDVVSQAAREPIARPRRAPIDSYVPEETKKKAKEVKRRVEYEIKTSEMDLLDLKLGEQEVVKKILEKLEPLYGRGKALVHIMNAEEIDPNKNPFVNDHTEAEGLTRLIEYGKTGEFEIHLFFRNRGTNENPLIYAEAVDEEIRHGLQLGKNPGKRLDLADEEKEKLESAVKKARSIDPFERASQEQLAKLVFGERTTLFISYGVNLDLVREASLGNFSHLETELSTKDQEKLQKQAQIYLLALQNAHAKYEQSLSFLERNLRKSDRFSMDAAKGIPRFMLEMAIADAAWYLLQWDIDGLWLALSHLGDSEFFVNYLTFHTLASSGTEGMSRIQSFVKWGQGAKVSDYRHGIVSRASGVALAEFATTYFGRLISHPLWREYEKNPSFDLSCQIAKEIFFDPYNFAEAGIRATSFVTASYLVDFMAKTIMVSQRAPLPPPARIALGSLTFLIHRFFTSFVLPEIDQRRAQSNVLEKREQFLAIVNTATLSQLSETFSELHHAFDEYRTFLHREVIETMEKVQSKFLDLEREYGARVATLNLLDAIDEFGEEETYGYPMPTSRNNFTSELKAPRFRIGNQWYGVNNLGNQIINAEETKPLYDGTPPYEGLPSEIVGPYSPTVLRMKLALTGMDQNKDGQLSPEEKKLIPQKMKENLDLYEKEKAALEKEYDKVLSDFAERGLFESGKDKFLKTMEEDLEKEALGPGAGRSLNQETMLLYKNGSMMLLPRMNLEEDFITRRTKVIERESQAELSRNRLSTYGQEIALIHYALQTIKMDPQKKSLLEGYLKLIANQWYLDETGAAQVRGKSLKPADIFDEILYSTTSSL